MRNLIVKNALTGNSPAQPQQGLADIKKALTSFHEDDRGDNENLGRMLVLGLILVPIVIILVKYGKDITSAVKDQWDQLGV